MDPESRTALKKWLKTVPKSKMVWPDVWPDRLKYVFWRVYTPYHTMVRDAAIFLRVVHHSMRQEYVLGTIAPGVSFEDFVTLLAQKGFARHKVAWKDTDEIVSLRKVEDFKFQYHVRIFEDREVRGHYEYTPESHPFSHMRKDGQEPCREAFASFFDGLVVPL